MRMRINEAGRNQQAGRVDRRRRLGVGGRGDADDSVPDDADVRNARRRAAAVDDVATEQQHVILLGNRLWLFGAAAAG